MRHSYASKSVRAARSLLMLLPVASLLGSPTRGAAQEGHRDEYAHGPAGDRPNDHHGGLHLAHPLIAESVSPDTKIRLDHQFFRFSDGDHEHALGLEAEYAFHRSFSIEAGLPFSYSATEFGNLEAVLKFANYAFEDAGLLLGYGIEFVFPTNGTPDAVADHSEQVRGRDRAPVARRLASTVRREAVQSGEDGAGVEGTLGTDEWEVAPFVNIGFATGALELVAWTFFEIPFAQAEVEEVETEIAFNFSALYHLTPRLQGLVELDGSGGISGPAVGEDVLNLSPGFRVRVLPDRPLVFGASVGFPIAGEKPFDARVKASMFWHF